MQASKANESVSDCSKTGLCIYKVKGLRMVSRELHESHLNVTGVQFFRLQIWTEISHSLGLQKFTVNQIRLNETLVLDMWQPEMCFDRLEKQP